MVFGLFKKQKPQPQAPRNPVSGRLSPWDIPRPRETVMLTGERERDAYIYDPSPLQGISFGEQVVFDLFPGDAVMSTQYDRGAYTQISDFDTRQNGNTCIMSNGRPVGFVTVPRSITEQAAMQGIALQVTGTVYGMLADYPGVPDVRVALPERVRLGDIVLEESMSSGVVPREHKVVEYNEYDSEDYAALVSRDFWEFQGARLELVPPPSGSKAKPKIAVLASDGTLISRVTGRNGYYKDMVKALENGTQFYVTAKKWVKEDGSIVYKIILRYW